VRVYSSALLCIVPLLRFHLSCLILVLASGCVCVCFDIAMVNIVVSVFVFMRAVWHDKPK